MKELVHITLRGYRFLATFMLFLCLSSCMTGQITGNENGSLPANGLEVVEYKKALLRCYRTGGSRVVKIRGELQCF